MILDERPLPDEGLKDWLTQTTAEELGGSLVESRAQGLAQIVR